MAGILASFVDIHKTDGTHVDYSTTEENVKYICIEEERIRIKKIGFITEYIIRNIEHYTYMTKEEKEDG